MGPARCELALRTSARVPHGAHASPGSRKTFLRQKVCLTCAKVAALTRARPNASNFIFGGVGVLRGVWSEEGGKEVDLWRRAEQEASKNTKRPCEECFKTVIFSSKRSTRPHPPRPPRPSLLLPLPLLLLLLPRLLLPLRPRRASSETLGPTPAPRRRPRHRRPEISRRPLLLLLPPPPPLLLPAPRRRRR